MATATSRPFQIRVAAPVGGLPAWASPTALPPGTFREVGLNTMDQARPPFAHFPSGCLVATLANWCSAAFIGDFSPRGGVAYWGGGEHGCDNASYPVVMIWNAETRLFEYACAAKVPHFQFTSNKACANTDPTDDWGHWLSDGGVQPIHSYNGLAEYPSAWGGGPRGSLLCGARKYSHSHTRQAPGWNHTMSFNLSFQINPGTRIGGIANYVDGPNPTEGGEYVGCCKDTLRQGWWSTIADGYVRRILFTHKSGTITATAEGMLSYAPGCSLHHFPDVDALTIFRPFNAALFFGLKRLSPEQKTSWIPLSQVVNGTAMALDANGTPRLVEDGPRWSSLAKRFVWLRSLNAPGNSRDATPHVCSLIPSDPNNVVGSTWSYHIEAVTPADASAIAPNMDAASFNGSLGKLVEIPSLRAFAWTRSHLHRTQLIRPSWMPMS